jgi:hypothetical protein
MKIIFDRSAFHRERFDLLKASHLSELVQVRKILIYHTAEFLDETLRMADSERQDRKDELKRQWPFLQSSAFGLFGRVGRTGARRTPKSVRRGI